MNFDSCMAHLSKLMNKHVVAGSRIRDTWIKQQQLLYSKQRQAQLQNIADCYK